MPSRRRALKNIREWTRTCTDRNTYDDDDDSNNDDDVENNGSKRSPFSHINRTRAKPKKEKEKKQYHIYSFKTEYNKQFHELQRLRGSSIRVWKGKKRPRFDVHSTKKKR